MIIRRAVKRDLEFISNLYDFYDFKLEPKHLQSLAVSEVDNEIVAVMSLNTVLECCFLTGENASRKSKIQALKRLVEVGISETQRLGYDGVHAFANDKIASILKKHFEFKPGKGENLFLFVEE